MELVVVGKLGRSRGLKGDLYVIPETDYPERFNGMTEIHVSNSGGWEIMAIEATSMIGGRPVIKFVGVSSPEAAARLTNRQLAVARDSLVTLPEGEYFIFDLIGCEVFEEEGGERVGVVSDVEQYPANDVYVVKTASPKPLLIPVVGRYVKSIDIKAKRIVVDSSGLSDA